MSDAAIDVQLKIHHETVAMRRRQLGIAALTASARWTKEADAFLGTAPDPVIAAQLQIHIGTVANRRRQLGISPGMKWTAEMEARPRMRWLQRSYPAQLVDRLPGLFNNLLEQHFLETRHCLLTLHGLQPIFDLGDILERA